MRLRHSQLEDGGGGALVVGVSEDLLGVVIERVVLEAASNGAASRSGGSRNGAHTCEAACARQCRAWSMGMEHGSMAAWGMAEHGHARTPGQSTRMPRQDHSLDCRTQKGHTDRARGALFSRRQRTFRFA